MLIPIVGYVVKLSGFLIPGCISFLQAYTKHLPSSHKGLLADSSLQYIFRSTIFWLGPHKEGTPGCPLSAIGIGKEPEMLLSEAKARLARSTTFTEFVCGRYRNARSWDGEQTSTSSPNAWKLV